MSVRPTIANLQATIAERDTALVNLYPQIRVLTAMVPAMYDACDRFVSIDVDERDRLVAYGFEKARGSYDVVVAGIGTGAGESVLNVECGDIDVMIARYDAYRLGSDVALAYRRVAERLRHWIACEATRRGEVCGMCSKV